MVCYQTGEGGVFHQSDYCLIRVGFYVQGLSSLSRFGGTITRAGIFPMMLGEETKMYNCGLALS